jgi:GT2 family glycosyltransferase
MITVGFSTREINDKFIEHIKSTSGIKDIEVIPFENKGTHSLTEAYDELLKKSNNDIVVLCHDDIRFKTKKWGQRLLNHFNNSDYGILGVAGTYHFKENGKWWEDSSAMVGIVNHINPNTKKEFESKYSSSVGDEIIPVVSLDGLFIALDKNKIKYDFDTNVKGFHFYDVDFTFGNYNKGVEVGCITNIRILHESVGMTNNSWEENRIKFAEKWKDSLPSKHEKTEIFYSKNSPKLNKTPKVSVVILNKSANELLFNCIDSFLDISEYPNYEIIVGDTGSSKDEIEEFSKRYQQENINLYEIGSYNFARNNNFIVENYVSEESEVILFCNNDIKLINDVLTHMISFYLKNKKTVGTIGGRLYFENKTIQHSGIIAYVNQNGQVMLSHHGINSRYIYHNTNKEVLGNTGALMMINKELFKNINGFSTEYNECFEDVDLNNELIRLNKKNIFISDAVAFHYESQTRNKDEEKNNRQIEDFKKVIPKLIDNTKCHKYLIPIR